VLGDDEGVDESDEDPVADEDVDGV
jgi:hypothetical protein